MDTITIQLDEGTLARAKQLAAARRCSLDELLRSLIAESAAADAADLVGFLADEPELADRILEDVYQTRERQSLRTPPHGSGSA